MAVNPLRDLRAWQERLERISSHHSDTWSPAIDVYRLLEQRGATVRYHDPFIPTLRGDHGHGSVDAQSVPLTDELLAWADCVVIATDHSQFDYRRVVEKSRLVVDARNATARVGRKLPNVVKL